jgi:hypothetical protein
MQKNIEDTKQGTKLILIRFLKKLNLQSRIYAQMVEIIMN